MSETCINCGRDITLADARWTHDLTGDTACYEATAPEPYRSLVAEPDLDLSSDETWRQTYTEKPEWWDDPTEPRCDVCGVHTEEALDYLRDPANNDQDRYPGGWCGECGNCADHCTCDD